MSLAHPQAQAQSQSQGATYGVTAGDHASGPGNGGVGNGTGGPPLAMPFPPMAQSAVSSGSGWVQPHQLQKREGSPVRDADRMGRVTKAREGIDLRAEEDAARRMNVGRVTGSGAYGGANARGKRTDLFGPGLRAKLLAMSKDRNLTFDDDTLSYLSIAAETRLRSLLNSSMNAQRHRTATSHVQPPPSIPSGTVTSGSGPEKKKRPAWSVAVTSDTHAVLEALNRQAKEAEQSFRASRMDRIAKETEMERARDRDRQAEQLSSGTSAEGLAGVANGTSANASSPSGEGSKALGPGNGNGAGKENSISNDSGTGASTTAATQSSGVTAIGASNSSPDKKSSPPVFGAVVPKKKQGAGGSGKKSRDVSADTQHKIVNAMAMRQAGSTKQYSWMTSAPAISSPLTGKKGKGKAAALAGVGVGSAADDGSGLEGGLGKSKKRKKLDGQGINGGPGPGSGEDQDGTSGTVGANRHKRARARHIPSAPPRRKIVIDRTEQGLEITAPDDRVITLVDVVFAMERDKDKGRGMGSGDQVLTKVYARPGGLYQNSRP